MLDALGKEDTLARLGGDEFAVLMPEQSGPEVIEKVKRMQDALDRPFTVRGLTVHIEASIGVASFPEHAEEQGRAGPEGRCRDVPGEGEQDRLRGLRARA